MSISVSYFYLLERKALQGLLEACEAQPKGPSVERQLSLVQAELARCQRECQRQAARVPVTQRAVDRGSVAPPTEVPHSDSEKVRHAASAPAHSANEAFQEEKRESAERLAHGT